MDGAAQQLYDSLEDVFYRTDLEGNITEISPTIEKYIGLKPEQVIGRPATDFYLNPQDRAQLLSLLNANGLVKDYQLHLKTPDNKTIYASLNARLLTDGQNQPKGVEGVLRDITARHVTEKMINDILSTTQDHFLLINTDKKVAYCSPSFARLCNKPLNEIKDQELSAIGLSIQLQNVLHEKFNQVQSTQKAETGQVSLTDNPNDPKYTYTIQPVYDDTNQIYGLVCNLHPVSGS
jgi:PAS domain S-box-containing protein